jgi:hypothetical protein
LSAYSVSSNLFRAYLLPECGFFRSVSCVWICSSASAQRLPVRPGASVGGLRLGGGICRSAGSNDDPEVAISGTSTCHLHAI